jgi:hypothetical protein
MTNPSFESEMLPLPLPFSPQYQCLAMISFIKNEWSSHPQMLRNLLPALERWRSELQYSAQKIDECISFATRRAEDLERQARLEAEAKKNAPQRVSEIFNAMFDK